MKCCTGSMFSALPTVFSGSAQLTVTPSCTVAAAFCRTAGVMKLSAPRSSSSPHRPQFFTRSKISPISPLVLGTARVVIARPLLFFTAKAPRTPRGAKHCSLTISLAFLGVLGALAVQNGFTLQTTRRTLRAMNEARLPTLDSRLPLSHVRVVDFSWIVAGPQATRILADLGADVIRVEYEGRVDSVRLGNPVAGAPRASVDHSGMFSNFNRNKRSVTLNVMHPDGMALLHDLLRVSDVVIENFSPRVLEGWGLTYEAMA